MNSEYISNPLFENDGTPQELKSGEEFSDLKIIIFSVEDKPYKI